MNFTVSRPGLGQIRWLRPVDVSGLALDRIVAIQQGDRTAVATGRVYIL